MIDILLALLLALSNGTDICTLGSDIDWTAYASEVDSKRVAAIRDADVQFDLYHDAATGYVLFVYADNMQEGVDGHPHGRCAVSVPQTPAATGG